ncbi:MAG: hypothetical protein HY560_07470 [Gemmatimonadetes bacterium]|nr:hypothetical protein [Gemmatimonadota bacterium]
MFIELTEFLRCPAEHPDAHCVLVPEQMAGRSVIRGVVGCPACRRQYSISDGVVRFGLPPALSAPPELRRADAVAALLGLTGPGGYVVLVGSAVRLGKDLASLLGGIHFVGVNAPAGDGETPALSLLEAEASVPLRSAVARGVVLGAEYLKEPWTDEAVRVLLRGLRLITFTETAEIEGLDQLAAGKGMWVGEKGR